MVLKKTFFSPFFPHMNISNLSPRDEEESLSSDSQFNLSNVIKEEFELENFDIPETNPQSKVANFMKFTL